jgi:hypothetical protein
MNHAKISAALHALADAFLEGVEVVEEKVKGKPKAKAAVAEVAAPVAVEAAAPVVAAPTVTKEQLNKLVLAVAAKGRDKAEAILSKFGATNTVNLPAEKWQVVYDAFEEELAKIDAAAVQVAQASLV